MRWSTSARALGGTYVSLEVRANVLVPTHYLLGCSSATGLGETRGGDVSRAVPFGILVRALRALCSCSSCSSILRPMRLRWPRFCTTSATTVMR